MRPPLNLQTYEMLSAVVVRLLRALRRARPGDRPPVLRPGQPALRWELNDLARRLDEMPAAVDLREELLPSPAGSDSGLTPDGRRILDAIDNLPEGEREAFDQLPNRESPRRS
jgi:hypothetical protein